MIFVAQSLAHEARSASSTVTAEVTVIAVSNVDAEAAIVAIVKIKAFVTVGTVAAKATVHAVMGFLVVCHV